MSDLKKMSETAHDLSRGDIFAVIRSYEKIKGWSA